MIKKNESKFVVTDSKISKAKHMKETKQFKAFRNTLNESEYKFHLLHQEKTVLWLVCLLFR